jgi:large subunit ribosomal protein L9
MEVLLKADIEKLGRRGEIVNVSPGYARNYLIPQNLATAATSESKREFEAQQRGEIRRHEADVQRLAQLAGSLEVTSCTVLAQANPEGHLFGSVGPQAICDAFAKDGIGLKAAMILLDEPFKEAGVFPVQVRLTPDLVATTRVWIMAI